MQNNVGRCDNDIFPKYPEAADCIVKVLQGQKYIWYY